MPEHWRRGFVQEMRQRLEGFYQPSNTVLLKVIAAALPLGTDTTTVSLCDATPTQQEATMGRTFRYGDEDDEQILGPGDRLVVPMSLMDSMDQRTAAIEEAKRSTYRAAERLGLHNRPDARITDSAGDSGLSLHKPGFRVSTTVTRDRSIYDSYDAEIASAPCQSGMLASRRISTTKIVSKEPGLEQNASSGGSRVGGDDLPM